MSPTSPTHLDITHRMDRMEEKLSAYMDEMRLVMENLQGDVATMKSDVAETKEIVEAWGAVKLMGKFIKWASGILTSIVAGYIIIKEAAIAIDTK